MSVTAEAQARAEAGEEVWRGVPKRMYIRRGDLESCLGCKSVIKGGAQQSHNDACRRRILAELGSNDPRVEANEAKLNEYLAPEEAAHRVERKRDGCAGLCVGGSPDCWAASRVGAQGAELHLGRVAVGRRGQPTCRALALPMRPPLFRRKCEGVPSAGGTNASAANSSKGAGGSVGGNGVGRAEWRPQRSKVVERWVDQCVHEHNAGRRRWIARGGGGDTVELDGGLRMSRTSSAGMTGASTSTTSRRGKAIQAGTNIMNWADEKPRRRRQPAGA